MSFKLLSTIPGKSVTTGADTADPRNLLVSSDFNSLKSIFTSSTSGTGSFTTNGSGAGSFTFTHSLGVVPSFRMFVEDVSGAGNWTPDINFTDFLAGDSTPNIYVTEADTTTLKVVEFQGANSTTYLVRYFVWVDQGA